MSLNTGLSLAYSGLRKAESQISVTSQNITNANKPGYTRKTFDSNYITTNAGTSPHGGSISSSLSKSLLKALYADMATAGRSSVISEYMSSYATNLGNVATEFSLSSGLNNLLSNLGLLAATPENPAQKSQIISNASVLANMLRDTSAGIQKQRLQADQEISSLVNEVNTILTNIDTLNEKISTSSNTNQITIAELEDQRALALENLSELIDVSYFYDSNNRLQIYQTGGQPLLLGDPYKLEFSSVSNMDSNTAYPGLLSGVELNGVDITSSIRGGRLGGLIELRDTTLVQEQEKFDEFANQMMSSLNGILNQGASLPPRTEMIGDSSAPATFTAAGSVRIALTSTDGTVQSVTDLNLAGITNTADMVTALNTVPGINASLSASGELVLASTVAGQGISINEMTSAIGADGQGFSDYFGLNDFFRGGGAENIRVADYLIQNPSYLATGSLSNTAALAAGDIGVTAGDVSIINALSTAINAPASFNAAGDFPGQTATLAKYSENIIAAGALKAAVAEEEFNIDQNIFQQTYDFVKNESGVNVDEETAYLLQLENYYQASATVISTIRDLFQELIAAVR